VASPIALGLTTTAFASPPLFSPPAHAHAAAIALSCLCHERLLALERAWPRLALGPLRAAALLWGLLIAEQPTLAAVLLLAAAPGLRRLFAAYRLPLWNLAPLALGAPLWLFGALARAPELGLPSASSPLAMLTAAFALAADPQLRPWAFAATDPASVARGALLALAAAGSALGLRARATRRFAALWLGGAAAALVGALNLAHGAACWALLLCAAAALASLALAPLLGGETKNALAPALAVVLVLFGATALYSAAADARARDWTAADALGDPLRRQLPAHAALLLAPELAAAWLDAEREERVRPDLLAALQPWQLDLRAAERVAAHSPELLPLLRAQLLAPAPAHAVAADARAGESLELPRVELAALAARRPVLLELQADVAVGLRDALLPYGLYHQVSTHNVNKSDVELAARDADRRLARLDAQLDLTRLPADAARLLAQRYRAELAYAEAVPDAALAERARARLRALEAEPDSPAP
jgi:hypothetical protein